MSDLPNEHVYMVSTTGILRESKNDKLYLGLKWRGSFGYPWSPCSEVKKRVAWEKSNCIIRILLKSYHTYDQGFLLKMYNIWSLSQNLGIFVGWMCVYIFVIE